MDNTSKQIVQSQFLSGNSVGSVKMDKNGQINLEPTNEKVRSIDSQNNNNLKKVQNNEYVEPIETFQNLNKKENNTLYYIQFSKYILIILFIICLIYMITFLIKNNLKKK